MFLKSYFGLMVKKSRKSQLTGKNLWKNLYLLVIKVEKKFPLVWDKVNQAFKTRAHNIGKCGS